MERLFTAQQVLESWNKSCKAIDDVDQEAKDIVREALELKIAEEQGLILRLPCKIGDKVYQIEDGYIYKFNARSIDVRKENEEYIFCIDSMDYKMDDFGKTVFLTKEDAEQALAERKNDE